MVFTWPLSIGIPASPHVLASLHNSKPSWSHGQLVWVDTYPMLLSSSRKVKTKRGTTCLAPTLGIAMLKMVFS